ncbi:restriction endonuclease subunit S [Escherichia coli]|uniref:restriction endonuclease subunit S n=1 Tax=Escherichia fergusonii TaxID=564 RepID=UPI001A033A22|nr:restriction endonuclease subunit S [Escherichia coli]EGP6254163.1 restriction endonuclease subunit S [Escherichia coli]EHJ4094674.1 restriction endonuclease subunit S [Escherichia fergusonii]EHJ4135850.1 restriction endonuclease subunit S [Escherichia fergusonii]HDP7827217.1 restriction endonuclease subunit S [Escherichia coli]
MSWPMVKLGDVCQITMGQAPSGSFYNEKGQGYALIAGAGDFGKLNPIPKKYTTKASKLSKSGDIIICIRATIGDLNWSDKEYCLGRGVAGLRGKESLYQGFLWHFLNYNKNVLSSKGTGSTFKQISRNHIEELIIPLPPIEEQKRIAAILDKADGILQKREQAIKLADDFLRASFLEMFGDPVGNPKGWKKNKIKKGVLNITSGWSATGENIPCKFDEFGVLKISSVTSGAFKPEENKVVACESIPASKKLIHPKKGDLLFSRANTRELVAAICMVHQDYDNLFLPDKLWSIKLNHELLLPEFFLILIQNEKVRELLTKQATGTSGSMLNISKGKFEETEIIFPEINVQKDFRNTFIKTSFLKEKLIKSNELANESFNSLSQKVFQQ